MTTEIISTNKAADSDLIESATVKFTFDDLTVVTVNNIGIAHLNPIAPEGVLSYLESYGLKLKEKIDFDTAQSQVSGTLVGLTSETPVIGA